MTVACVCKAYNLTPKQIYNDLSLSEFKLYSPVALTFLFGKHQEMEEADESKLESMGIPTFKEKG